MDNQGQAKPVTPGTSLSGVAAAILIVLFFTPWFSACNVQVSGADLAGGMNGSMDGSTAWWLFGVPLVGLAVIGIAIRNLNQPLAGIARRARYVLALAVYPLLCIALLYVQLRASSSEALLDVRPLIRFEFGFWGTLLASMVMMAGAVLDLATGRGLVPGPARVAPGPPYPAEAPRLQPPPQTGPPHPRAWLQGQAGGFAQQALELMGDTTRIGSGAECEALLREPNAAEVHAVVRYARGQYYLQDRGSPSGTLLNGQRVGASVLQDGDLITIGRTALRFRQR